MPVALTMANTKIPFHAETETEYEKGQSGISLLRSHMDARQSTATGCITRYSEVSCSTRASSVAVQAILDMAAQRFELATWFCCLVARRSVSVLAALFPGTRMLH
eukprot:267643-Amphidinium_carterae.2